MNEGNIYEAYDEIYEALTHTRNVGYMRMFGCVATKMFKYIAEHDRCKAEEMLAMLEPIKWHNYLSEEEAEDIVEEMVPPAIWGYDEAMRAVSTMGYNKEEAPYYNSYALWVAMSMIYSDDAETIAHLHGKDREHIDTATMVKSCYMLAIDRLKDPDGKFEIRSYFL